ncbi:RHS repeat-associated core domain-containing protein [Pseudomonas sp.]|uniref:RHS repeat-associated core domain-containing protein n=1 Tax=Pseudomonas sp. TaxID=306 RepID=UPI0028AF9BFF|nr:RHS repeat-associated core domain-containing protein [Pseudomonas sp.]
MPNPDGDRKSRLQNESMAAAFSAQGQHGHFCYEPYGYQGLNHAQTLLRFNGQWYEAISEGYLLGNGHRLYKPRLFRFHSADALSPFGNGGINCYAYCSGDPINKIDPSGRVGTGLSAMIKKHHLDRGYAKQALGGMAIPFSDHLVQAQTFTNSDGRIFTVYRNSSGRFSAIARPDPESKRLTAPIEQRSESIQTLRAMNVFETLHPLVHPKLFSGGEVMRGDVSPQVHDLGTPPPLPPRVGLGSPPPPPRTDLGPPPPLPPRTDLGPPPPLPPRTRPSASARDDIRQGPV